MADSAPLDFTSWRAAFVAALDAGTVSDVPCGGCTACCRSRQFVTIAPDESDTLAHVPKRLLSRVPQSLDGALVLPYRHEDGACPMLGPAGCLIYEHRPRACRLYDCRVFAAAGVMPDQPLIAERIRFWQFDESTVRRSSVRRARDYLQAGVAPLAAAVQAVVGSAHPSEGRSGRASVAIAESTPLTKRPDSSVE